MRQLLCVLLASIAQAAIAATPVVMINDLSPGSDSSIFRESVVFDGRVFFVAWTETTGWEVWSTDGTEDGTRLVTETIPGPEPMNSFQSPSNLTVVGDTLFFFAADSSHGLELWKTDGTASGTEMVRDIRVGHESGTPRETDPPRRVAMRYGDLLLFRATDGINGLELWKSDGTWGGTEMIKDISVGSGHSAPESITPIGLIAYFVATDPIHGFELWRTDGSNGGTHLVADIEPGLGSRIPPGSRPVALTALNGYLYFHAAGPDGWELYESDGTEPGTHIVKDIGPGRQSTVSGWITANATHLFFRARTPDTGSEPWISDGTEFGTSQLKDIVLGPDGSAASLRSSGFGFVDGNDLLLFSADDGVSGLEIWVSDGTPDGTTILKDIEPGSGSGFDLASAPDFDVYLEPVGNATYFYGHTLASGHELWRTNGTTEGTQQVADVNPGPDDGLNLGRVMLQGIEDTLLFAANDGESGLELWGLDRDGDALSDLAETSVFHTDPDEVDTDGDGIADGTEVELGTDPTDSDSDDDGIVDGSDPDVIVGVLMTLPIGAFANSGDPEGQRNAMLNILDDVQASIDAGEIDDAIRMLQNLRRKVDGCGATADRGDWISDCTHQLEVRALIDLLILNLSA